MGTSRALVVAGALIALMASASFAGCIFKLDDVEHGDAGIADGGGGSDAPATDAVASAPACKAKGANRGSCECNTGTCNVDCAGKCAVTCQSGTTCTTGCGSGGCELFCNTGATCTATCSGGGCTFHCPAGATCSTTCTGGNCTTAPN